jgi:hypothetical protein
MPRNNFKASRSDEHGNPDGALLPVVGQDLVAGLAQPGAILLEARQHG